LYITNRCMCRNILVIKILTYTSKRYMYITNRCMCRRAVLKKMSKRSFFSYPEYRIVRLHQESGTFLPAFILKTATVILSLWGASCCVMYTYTFQIYLQSQLRIYWCYLLFSLFTTCFGPYGLSSGEIQLLHLHILKKTPILQRIRCFATAHSYGASLLLSTLWYSYI
jgi:hypothetical protein